MVKSSKRSARLQLDIILELCLPQRPLPSPLPSLGSEKMAGHHDPRADDDHSELGWKLETQAHA